VAHISNEAVRRFQERFDGCMKRVGHGQVAVDSLALRALVRDEPEVTTRVTELYCLMAASNPAYFQGAMGLATAYLVEFKDRRLVEMVNERVKSAGAEEWLSKIQTGQPADQTPASVPPEREAAKRWWTQTGRQEGNCDGCNRHMKRGEGYQVRGPVYKFGQSTIDVGECIICESCFTETSRGKVWR
jgi:hypothetical protein